jgi:pyridoxal phosphate enzyme (YggS family)
MSPPRLFPRLRYPDVNEIAANLSRIREKIAEASLRCGRSPDEVTLIAVTKTVPPETVREAIAAGHLRFGENRVQEAEDKIGRLRDAADLQWHLIGHLQSNKAKRAAELFDWIHSLDSLKLAQKLDQACAPLGKRLPVLLQVDLGEEETKFGAARDQAREIVGAVSELQWLRLEGLMSIPPFFENPERVRPFFAELRELRDALEAESPGCLGVGHLSMGMTNDFDVAIQEGATMVRIGTAIFGERNRA